MVEKFRLEDEMLEQYGVGYVLDKRYNERFEEQNLACPYEHCIETMPLYEDEEMEAVKKEMIVDLRKDPSFNFMDKDRIKELPREKPELYREIRKILDKKRMKDEECWFISDLNEYLRKFGDSPKNCGLYGHQCPGGEEQVGKCRLEERF